LIFDGGYEMLAFIYSVIVWVLVPAILLSLLFLSMILADTGTMHPVKVSGWAGFGSGLLLFIVFVVSVSQTGKNSGLGLKYTPQFSPDSLIPLGVAFSVGFFLLWGIVLLRATRFVGVMTLILSAASSIGLFSYYFVGSLRYIALFSALGAAVGVLIHLLFFPNSLQVVDFNNTSEFTGVVVLIGGGLVVVVSIIVALVATFSP